MTETVLRSLYYNPETGFGGVEKLFITAKKLIPSLTRKEVSKFLAKQEASQIQRQPKINPHVFPPIRSSGLFESLQADMLDMRSLHPSRNKGYGWILTVVDIWSRKAFVVPVKHKSADEVAAAMKKVLIELPDNFRLATDKGSEFLNHKVKALLDAKGVNHTKAEIGDHHSQGIIERFNKTLRDLIRKYLTASGSLNWYSALPALVKNYNQRVHRTMKAAPEDIAHGKMKPAPNKRFDLAIQEVRKFRPGTKVRVQLAKPIIGTKAVQRFSSKVEEVDSVDKFRIYLKGDPKPHKFYELQIVGDVETAPKKESPEKPPTVLKPRQRALLKEIAPYNKPGAKE